MGILALLAMIPGFSTVQAIWLAVIAPIIAKIPLKVWLAIGGIIAVMLYGSYRDHKGFNRCSVKYEDAAKAEKARQAEVSSKALQKANERATAAQAQLDKTQEQVDDLNKQVAKLKNAKQVCLPKSVTDRIRRLQ